MPGVGWLLCPDTHRFVTKCVQDCNWLQALEGGIDSSHISFLHSSLQMDDYSLTLDMGDAGVFKYGESTSGSGIDIASNMVPSVDTPIYSSVGTDTTAYGVARSAQDTGNLGWTKSVDDLKVSAEYARNTTTGGSDTSFGITYAGVIVCLRYLKDEDSFWLIFLCFLVSWLVLLPYTETFDQRFEGNAWYWVFFMGTFQMAGAYSCFALGVKFITAQEGSLLALLEPVLNPIWVLLVWGIAIDDKTIIGASLISAGLILRYRIEEEKIEVNKS